MKNKIIIIVLFITVILVLIYAKSAFTKDEMDIRNLEIYQTENIPDFDLSIGSPNRETIKITKEDILVKDIKVYQFKGKIDNNWKVVENDYVGIRVTDLFKAYNITYENLDIEFSQLGIYSVKYEKDEINDDIFIVFFKDENPVGDIESISMISFKHKWNNSLTNINHIYIYEEPKVDIPIVKDE